jgi:hypothetical protein
VAVLGDVSGKNVISVGWYHASDEAHPDLPGPDDPPGLYAFKVWDTSAEYLGPVTPSGGSIAWSVDALEAGDHHAITYDLFAVTGWLVQTSPVSCPPPDDYGPDVNTDYWCGGSFVTAAPLPTHSGNEYYLQLPGLHVQWDAYQTFAPNQRFDPETGPEPRLGTYLVRSADCPRAVMGDCPVWRMVGRLDGTPQPGPTPTPAPSITATPAPTVPPSPSPSSELTDVFEPGGLHIQWGVYQDFAPDPSANHGQGTEPRFGTYLVRQIGCQPVTQGPCPVWRMFGRLV